MIPLFDLHCDTLTKLYSHSLKSNAQLHISFKDVHQFSPYIQVCAIWSNCIHADKEAYSYYRSVVDFSKNNEFVFSTDLKDTKYPAYILAIEDARLLDNSIDLLENIYCDGVRALTLMWKGESCIGGGWDTTLPLTAFGRLVVEKCAKLGIAVDLSHSSYETQNEVLRLANTLSFSPIYSHSNSYTICQHRRNVSDAFAKEIAALNGLIGISLCTSHLSSKKFPNIDTIITHIDYFLKIGCENVLSLGCDFDGIDLLPMGFDGISSLEYLFYIIKNKFGPIIAEKIFYYNAFNYFKRLLEGR